MAMRRRPQSQLGAKLFALRQASYLSREQVAHDAGISVHLLQSLEQGRTANPSVHTVIGLANALMVPVLELIALRLILRRAAKTDDLFPQAIGTPKPMTSNQ
jgi:transcriptional regulator with XRE-family HTH domain